MAEFVESTVREIDGRLATLEDEVSRLRAARAALVGGATQRRRGRAASTPHKTTAAPSTNGGAGRGGNTRASQALALVRARPGITIPEIAKELGIEPNYLYRVMPKLVQSGQIARQGQGWHPVS
jgi:CRP-like cAMP-binding protein